MLIYDLLNTYIVADTRLSIFIWINSFNSYYPVQ